MSSVLGKGKKYQIEYQSHYAKLIIYPCDAQLGLADVVGDLCCLILTVIQKLVPASVR